MDLFIEDGEEGCHRFLNEAEEMLLCMLVVHGLLKLLFNLENRKLSIARKIFYTRVDHEVQKVDDKLGVSSQYFESLTALGFERLVAFGIVATHTFNHFLAEPHRRWKRFRILPEYE